METEQERRGFCQSMGNTIEQMDGMEFIDDCLVDQDFDIYEKGGVLYIDFISGVNYYGEVQTSIEVSDDNSFRVYHNGCDMGPFQSDDLWDSLHDTLFDMIRKE